MAESLLEITVVVPALNAAPFLPRLLERIEAQSLLPREVVVVDASRDDATAEVLRGWRGRVPVLHHRLAFAYPGHARNTGVALARSPWIAFLDCRTVPAGDWLEQASAVVRQAGAEFVPGLFVAEAEGSFQRLLLAATYGYRPVTSLPGALLKKSVFERSGGFLPGARAGEDMEWLGRLEAQGVRKAQVRAPSLSYQGLPNTLREALGKWYVYALANSTINVLVLQKFFYMTLLFLVALLFIYNWNALFAGWDEESAYYVPNITKIFLAAVLALYGLTQGFVKPLRKGVGLRYLVPFNWVRIIALRVCLDTAKAPGMLAGGVLLLWNRVTSLRKVARTVPR